MFRYEDGVKFELRGTELLCMLNGAAKFSFLDLFDIFGILGNFRICSWQEFQLFSKPVFIRKGDKARRVYEKDDYKITIIDLDTMERRKAFYHAAKDNINDMAEELWITAVVVEFMHNIPSDFKTRFAGCVKKYNSNCEIFQDLWVFKWELTDGHIVTDKTSIDFEWSEPKHDLFLEEKFRNYLLDHKGNLYRLFNDAMQYDVDIQEEEEEEEEEYSDEY